VIAALAGIIVYSLIIINIIYPSYSRISSLVLSISISWPFGTAMVLLGAFLLTCRKHAASSDLWAASGVLYIVTAGSMFSVTGLLIAPSASFTAAILGGICFFTG
jgi:uncharacterized membrane protein